MTLPCHRCSVISPANTLCGQCKAVYFCPSWPCQKAYRDEHLPHCRVPNDPEPSPADTTPRYFDEYAAKHPHDIYGALLLQLRHLVANELTPRAESVWGFSRSEGLREDSAFARRWRIKDWRDRRWRRLLQNHRAGRISPGTFLPWLSDCSKSQPPVFHKHAPARLNYFFGENYVGVGFLDLFQLLMGEFHEQAGTPSPPAEWSLGEHPPGFSAWIQGLADAAQAEASPPPNTSLTFLGIDSSARAVARAHVIYRMLLDQDIACRSVLQVWFSTVLDREAHEALTRVCLSLLRGDVDIEDGPRAMIGGEFRRRLTAASAMNRWMDLVGTKDLLPLNVLLAAEDRVQFARYQFRGAVFCREEDAYRGNPTLVPALTAEEEYGRGNIFASVGPSCLREYNDAGDGLMQTVEQFYTGRAEALRDLVVRGKVVCQFLHRRVGKATDDADTVRRIVELAPAVVDWSNLADHLGPVALADYAAVCTSSETTLHTAHSSKWPLMVYGASAVDYAFLPAYKVDEMRDAAKNFLEMDRREEFGRRPWMERVFRFAGVRRFPADEVNAVMFRALQARFLQYHYWHGIEEGDMESVRLVYVEAGSGFNEVVDAVRFALGSAAVAVPYMEMLLQRYLVQD